MATFKEKEQRDHKLDSSSDPSPASLKFNQIKVGNKVLANDVFANLIYGKKRPVKIDAKAVQRALENNNLVELREISNHFFLNSGIYSRLCRYMAFLFKYDWIVTPEVYDEKIADEKIIEGWYKAASLLDNSKLKQTFGDIALRVIKDGCYYGYIVEQKTAGFLQELPINYCRSRYKLNGNPAVEFNVKYFDDAFSDAQYRVRVLKLFPKEFQKAYVAFKKGTLPKDFQGDDAGWVLLDPSKTVKFNMNGSDAPLFVSIIPKIMDLDEAQDIDKQRRLQQLVRLVVQQMPIDKNGDLIFDVLEARQLHQNAVDMLGNAIGVDVLTTFADVKVEDLSDKGNVTATDQLESVERTVYNEAGVSQMQFNTSGNLALEKSIANDEATMSNLLLQFETFMERLLAPFNKNPKRLMYTVHMLPTTVYNYKDLSKIYKEQTMIGFSKLLPQVALGQTQSNIIATAYFENKLLKLDELFVAPQMSSTMSGNNKDNGNTDKKKEAVPKTDNKGGRPEKPDSEKAEKTIQNLESES